MTSHKKILGRTVYVRTARKSCEHFCFLGAMGDMIGYMTHWEAAIFVFAGKAAFVIGALGVYLMHAEEATTMVTHLADAAEKISETV